MNKEEKHKLFQTQVADQSQQLCHHELPEARQYGSKRAAFTLAEVLITLGIIGIVAAMTIPTLMRSYEQKVIDVRFKKFYSNLQQAMLRVQNEFGYVPACYYGQNGISSSSSECDEFWKELQKQLRVLQVCKQAVQNGCMPKYNGLNTIRKNRNSNYTEDPNDGCNGFFQSRMDTNTAYILHDGTILFLYGNSWEKIMAFDVNGVQKPNKWGHDVFAFDLIYNGKYFGYTDTTTSGCINAMVEDNGFTPNAMIRRLFGTQIGD